MVNFCIRVQLQIQMSTRQRDANEIEGVSNRFLTAAASRACDHIIVEGLTRSVRIVSISTMFARILYCLACVAMTAAFRPVLTSSRRAVSALHMSDPMDAIRARMASDPSYDPMKDPQAMQQLESMIPTEMREFANSVERLKVSFTDATTGTNPLSDLDALGSIQASTKASDLLSAPTSQWFKEGAQDVAVDEGKLKDYLKVRVCVWSASLPVGTGCLKWFLARSCADFVWS